ncbi:hypothetical protein [Kitasatospora sp. Root107]|uniref:effector-associated constant component EACC1 n=1 Tax=Kitasatospora sp. Root107 TaxID=1736424 RepID=UPI00070A0C12|nr:hypothetical protein [Kitasatospora sp. Root107]KQV13675.1 hypothetical protein ASC99_33360 [Kitasatospora sp. Root107]
MRVEVRVGAADVESELRSLYNWLGQDAEVRRSAEVSLTEQPAPSGSMGDLLDAVQLVTDNGWSAASFVMTVLTWRQTRPRPPRLTLRRGDLEVSLADGTDEEVQRLLSLLTQPPSADREDGPVGGGGSALPDGGE